MRSVVSQQEPDPDLPADDNALSRLIQKNRDASTHPAEFHKLFTVSEKNDGSPGVKRTSDGVSVFGVDEVIAVFMNEDGNYSVKGYAERSSHAF